MDKQSICDINCAGCCVRFGITELMLERRRGDGQPFYCPNGHANEFKHDPAERKIEKLGKRVKELEEMLAAAQKEICVLSGELAVWKPRNA